MKFTHALVVVIPLLLSACGGGGSSGGGGEPIVDNTPNLPTGLPAGTTEDGTQIPELQPVSASIPLSQRISIGGFDSTHPDWNMLRRSSVLNTSSVCGDLMLTMIWDRSAPDESSADSISPQTWWYWDQGYTVTFDWSGSECEAEDFRFTPQF